MADYIPWFEQLRDPRWQEMRLKVMERDAFTCRDCADKSKTLNVHHKRYIKGNKAWEYDPSDLVTLCEDCHSERHKAEEELKDAIAVADDVGISQRAIGYVRGLTAFNYPNQPKVPITDAEQIMGLADATGIPQWILCDIVMDRTSIKSESLDAVQAIYNRLFGPKVPMEEQRAAIKQLLLNIQSLGGRVE